MQLILILLRVHDQTARKFKLVIRNLEMRELRRYILHNVHLNRPDPAGLTAYKNDELVTLLCRPKFLYFL